KAREESGRTLTAEITERLKKSFSDEVGEDLKDLRAEWRKGLEDLRTEWEVHFKILRRDVPSASEVGSEVASEIDLSGLNEVQSQIRAILSHLGLPDPVLEAKVQEAEKRIARMEGWGRPEAEIKRALEALEKLKSARIPRQTDKDDNGEKQ